MLQNSYVSVLLLQMIILSLIVKRVRVKALVKDKRVAMEAFGTYVEVDAHIIYKDFNYLIAYLFFRLLLFLKFNFF